LVLVVGLAVRFRAKSTEQINEPVISKVNAPAFLITYALAQRRGALRVLVWMIYKPERRC